MLAGRTAAAVPARVVDYQPDAIDLEIDAPGDGIVVLDEVAYPGWQVTVDDTDAPALRADYLLRAVYVGVGHHRIAWRFHPTRFRLLFALYLLALIALVASVIIPRRRPEA